MVFHDVGDLAQPLVGAFDGDLGQLFGRCDRRQVPDTQPLVRRIDEAGGARSRASRNVSGENQRALPVGAITCMSRTFISCSFAGSTCTCSCRRRSPQIETLATPLTPVNRGTMVQRASTDISMSDSFF